MITTSDEAFKNYESVDWDYVFTEETSVTIEQQNHSVSFRICLGSVGGEDQSNEYYYGYSQLCMKISHEIEFDQLSFIKLPKVNQKLSNVKDCLNSKFYGFGDQLQKIVDEKVGPGKKLIISKIDFVNYSHPDKGCINIKIMGKIDSKTFTVDAFHEDSDGGPSEESFNITEN